MRPPMTKTAYIVNYTRNQYGDYTATGETEVKCHFREITSFSTQDNEQLDSDAIIWLMPDVSIAENDIVKFDGRHFRVERLIKARKLRSNNVEFIKCELLKYGDIS